MNYKKVIKSRNIRNKILKLLSFIPDKTMLKFQYKIRLGIWPDFKNPKRYTEKIQLYKLYYRDPILHVCCDKYAVRSYLEEKGFGNLLPKLYGVYERAEDINFDKLPSKFVLKTNDGGGGNNVIICRDKSGLDVKKTIKDLNSWLNMKDINPGREWCYTGIPKSLIMAEELLEDQERPGQTLDDYKFYCFDGKIFCLGHDIGRKTDHHQRAFYDENWNRMDAMMVVPQLEGEDPIPESFEEMKNIVHKLAEGFPHIRVDLYYINKKIYFSELTFYTGSGYNVVEPDDFDFQMGEPFDTSSFYSTSV